MIKPENDSPDYKHSYLNDGLSAINELRQKLDSLGLNKDVSNHELCNNVDVSSMNNAKLKNKGEQSVTKTNDIFNKVEDCKANIVCLDNSGRESSESNKNSKLLLPVAPSRSLTDLNSISTNCDLPKSVNDSIFVGSNLLPSKTMNASLPLLATQSLECSGNIADFSLPTKNNEKHDAHATSFIPPLFTPLSLGL